MNMHIILTLWRVAAYFLPGLPRPTINQGSFCFDFEGSVAVVAMDEAEEFRTDNKRILKRVEIRGFVKFQTGKWNRNIEQVATFIIQK